MRRMTWDRWVGLVCQIVTAGAAFGALCIAMKALRTWRDQMVGGSQFELARSLLYNAHLLARGIESYRAVFSQQDRTPEGVGRSINEPAAELDRAFIQARLLFPDDLLEDERRQIKACVGELYLAITRYGREMKKPEDRQDRKKLQEYDATIWSPGDDDPFAERVEKALESLTKKLQPYIARA